jgi:hypothetical protein
MKKENIQAHLRLPNIDKLVNDKSGIQQLRVTSKALFIDHSILVSKDFYSSTEISYLPQKNVLKVKLDFNATFQQDVIAQSISVAHQKDESFEKIMSACKAELHNLGKNFSALMIMASGSGQLTPYLLEHLSPCNIRKISHKIYSVDISQTMSDNGRINFYKTGEMSNYAIDYNPVTADCTSYTMLQESIPELSQLDPLLVISHGGARYFVMGNERALLESFRQYPSGSSMIITEVGDENYKLLHNLVAMADAINGLNVSVSPQQDTLEQYYFWNLTFYYFLMQQYQKLPSFQTLIDNFLAEQNITNTHNYQWLVSLILLEIAGMRKQTVHTVQIDRC